MSGNEIYVLISKGQYQGFIGRLVSKCHFGGSECPLKYNMRIVFNDRKAGCTRLPACDFIILSTLGIYEIIPSLPDFNSREGVFAMK